MSKYVKKGEKDDFDKLYLDHTHPEPFIPLRNININQKDIEMDCKKYYPGEIVYEIPNVSKDLLKKNMQLYEISKLL